MGEPEFKGDEDLTKEERVWGFMNEEFRMVVEDMIALIIEIMPELKRYEVFRAKSKERETFVGGISSQQPRRPSLSVDEQRRIVDEHGSRKD